jgi:hypothetical protein
MLLALLACLATPDTAAPPAPDVDRDGVTADEDCNDQNATVFPGADEICDTLDQDCDGHVDEGVQGTFFPDVDGDEFGDPDDPLLACARPAGAVDDASDCDDTDPLVSPNGLEECDGVDNDCNGVIDGADAWDAVPYWVDGDDDGYGDPEQPDAACQVPEGAVENDQDCDDTLDTVSPEGVEVLDGVDQDCNGLPDDGLVWGSGADGPLEVVDEQTLSASCSAVLGIDEGVLELEDASGFSAGDRVILINLQGAREEVRVGTWGRFDVLSASSLFVTLTEPVDATYGRESNEDLSGQKVVLIRAAQHTTVDVSGRLTGVGWDGGCGGVLALYASESVTVSGRLDMNSAGFNGGERNTADHDRSGWTGEGTQGPGSRSTLANASGGGGGGETIPECYDCEGNGGGGGHGDRGSSGERGDPELGHGGQGGTRTGDDSLVRIQMGGGGGGGALDDASESGVGGAGGDGGGIVLVVSPSIHVTGAIAADGHDGETGCGVGSAWCGATTSEAGSGGGGAGGTVLLVGTELVLDPDAVVTTGGLGAYAGSGDGSRGGDGAVGRIGLTYSVLNGVSWPASAQEQVVSDPAPSASAELGGD